MASSLISSSLSCSLFVDTLYKPEIKLISHSTVYVDPTHIDGLVNRQDDVARSLQRQKNVRAVRKGLDYLD